ncbi:TPA: hypothetical protein ACXR0B_004849, partial [Klebsiella variicola subsp. variicola]
IHPVPAIRIAKTPPERGFLHKEVKLTDKPRSSGIASWTVIHPDSGIRIAKTPPERGFCIKR